MTCHSLRLYHNEGARATEIIPARASPDAIAPSSIALAHATAQTATSSAMAAPVQPNRTGSTAPGTDPIITPSMARLIRAAVCL